MEHSQVMVMQPVLEIGSFYSVAPWTIAPIEPGTYLPLSGALTSAEVGTAVANIALSNNPESECDDRPSRSDDPLGWFLYGLLTVDDLISFGGLRVTDHSTGTTLLPGCCDGLEEWRDWYRVVDGNGVVGFGHDPSPMAQRLGDTARLTVDADRRDSPVIDLSITDLRRLLADAERDLTDFLTLATGWASQHTPTHSSQVTNALARALALPGGVTW